jgi:phosphonopyruvate decarboxylase
MLDPKKYLDVLKDSGVTFSSGVPDSLLKELCACISDKFDPNKHIIAANEGAAVGLAIGHHIATGGIPLVYFQNSGLGNVINPLLSLASPEIYGIPMLFVVGWRGEPGVKDEPQHLHQGRVMMPLIEAMEIPKFILSTDPLVAETQTRKATKLAFDERTPVMIVVKKGSFQNYSSTSKTQNKKISREEAIIKAAESVEENAVVVATTGMASRELFEYRAFNQLGHHKDFLTVGGMGHANQIALGIALGQPTRPVYCFDGDGASIMHMGSLSIIGQSMCHNFTHIVFNNGVHGSVGGQPTVAFDIELTEIARGCGYKSVFKTDSLIDLELSIDKSMETKGPVFIEVQTTSTNRKDLGRPTSTPAQNKEELMRFLGVK